ncbi:carboxypeptidase regulatory-like domain-containing protein [Jatrophihabitans fulvus]
MRVDVTPDVIDVAPGRETTVIVTVTNTADIIGGYALRVLGADPGWVTLSEDSLSLFPDEVRAVQLTVEPPPGLTAGTRRLAVQVRELTEPYDSVVADIDLVVPAVPDSQLRVDPLVFEGGKRSSFSLLVENTGNTELDGYLSASDPESEVQFEFEPDRLVLAPGQHAVVEMRARAKRPFFGSPAVRSLSVFVDDAPAAAVVLPAATDDENERQALAGATFIQKPIFARGALALMGLLAAATVFALLISLALTKLVAQSAADRNLALQVAAAQDSQNDGSGSSGVSGTVRQLTTGAGARSVTVNVYDASDAQNAIASTTTKPDGTYAVSGLAAGSYKLSFRGAGLTAVWYPASATPDNASDVTLEDGKVTQNINVTVSGVPAKISGTVSGDDVGAATLYLESGSLPAVGSASGTGPDAGSRTRLNAPATPGSPTTSGAAAPGAGAVVQQVPIGSDGTFTLSNVPSPSVYRLVVVKAGYATAVQRVDVGAGEDRKGVQVQLVKGDGLISGTVTGEGRRLGGASLVATSGSSTASTVSVTGTGTFALRALATPATYTVVVSAKGFGAQTLSLSLTQGQHLQGVDISLSKSSATVQGIVTLATGTSSLPQAGSPGDSNELGGVSVTITDGTIVRQTTSASSGAGVGTWQIRGLPRPGSYTATFSRSDLETQTIAVAVDASGVVTAGSGTLTAQGIPVVMRTATGRVAGYISQVKGTRHCGSGARLGEASVTLSSGSSSFAVTSASVGDCGRYVFDAIPPGTYTLSASTSTGTTPTSRSVTVVAGESVPASLADIVLNDPASVTGTVVDGKNKPLPNWTVFLYQRDQYPGIVYRSKLTDGRTGAFAVNDVEAGQYVVAVSPTPDPGDAVTYKRVTVRPSTTSTITVKVNR